MGKYGESAKIAVSYLQSKVENDPAEAWKKAVKKVFPNSVSARKKGCPKSAFLGLCEVGKVKNVSVGIYTRSKENKNYAIEALALLNENPELAFDKSGLWKKIMKGNEKKHNSQMDVVVSLFDAGLIK